MRIPGAPLRPDVVSLLVDINPVPGVPVADWEHLDGRPLADVEVATVLSATPAELRAWRDYDRRAADYYRDALTAADDLVALTEPFFTRLGPGATLAQVAAAMTPEERVELRSILDRLPRT